MKNLFNLVFKRVMVFVALRVHDSSMETRLFTTSHAEVTTRLDFEKRSRRCGVVQEASNVARPVLPSAPRRAYPALLARFLRLTVPTAPRRHSVDRVTQP